MPHATITDLTKYEFEEFAKVTWDEETKLMKVQITNAEIGKLTEAIYAFVVGGEVVRFGSRKTKLASRVEWRGTIVTNYFRCEEAGETLGSTCAKKKEAYLWRDCLRNNNNEGSVYGRQGTRVQTPAGEFRAYLDEERVLIEKHAPIINPAPR